MSALPTKSKKIHGTVLAAALLVHAGAAQAPAWYSPQTGTWLTRDPLEEEGALMLHSFAANDPIDHVDPTGLIPLDTIWDIGNIVYDIAIGDYVSLTADVAALAVPYFPSGATKLVKSAKVAEVVRIDAKAINTLRVEYQYLGNAQGFFKHTLPPGAQDWIEATKGNPSKFMPGWGDGEITKLINEALAKARREGKLKPTQLNGFVYDTQRFIGASDGCLAMKIEIKINRDGKNLHAYPVK